MTTERTAVQPPDAGRLDPSGRVALIELERKIR